MLVADSIRAHAARCGAQVRWLEDYSDNVTRSRVRRAWVNYIKQLKGTLLYTIAYKSFWEAYTSHDIRTEEQERQAELKRLERDRRLANQRRIRAERAARPVLDPTDELIHFIRIYNEQNEREAQQNEQWSRFEV